MALQLLLLFLSVMSVSAPHSIHSANGSAEHEVDRDIEYECNQALIIQHLQDAYNRKIPVDLSNPDVFRILSASFDNYDDVVSSTAILNFLMQPEEQLSRSSVREVIVSGRSAGFNLTLLDTVFSGLKDLETVRWYADSAISPAILRSLEMNSPSAKLYYTLSFRNLEHVSRDGSSTVGVIGQEYDHRIRDAARHSIINSSNLYSLKGEIEYGGSPNRDDMHLIWRALISCPNVRELYLSLNWSGCEASGGQPYSFDFHSNSEAKLPPLEVLRLKDYDFLSTDNREWSDAWRDIEYSKQIATLWRGFVERTMNSLLVRHPFLWSKFVQINPKEVPLRPKESNRTNLEDWMKAMDWSKLHTLDLSLTSVKVLELLKGPPFSSLKHFTFGPWPSVPADQFVDFLADVPLPLESIILKDVTLNSSDSLLSIIGERHGSALKNLRLTKGQDRGSQQFLSTHSITQLRDSCPNIETLEIDIGNTKNWDYQLLHALVSFPQLRHLSLQLTIKLPNEDPHSMDEFEFKVYRSNRRVGGSQINHNSAPRLFRYLRKHKLGRELEKMDIYSIFYGTTYPDYYLSELQDYQADIRCFVDEYGVEVCE